MLGITGASVVATGVLGGLALAAESDLDEELTRFPGDPAAISDAQDRTSAMAIGADVMLGVTAAGAITTVVLFIVTGVSDEPTAVEVPEGPKAVSVSPAGLGLRLTF